MTIEVFCRQLASALAAAPAETRAEVATREIAAFFHVQEHEVGLFQVNPLTRVAVLRAPRSIGSPATIPLQSIMTSLLGTTVREKRGQIDNAFSDTPHLHIVERTLADPEQRIPVQKIMSVPVVVKGEVCWVLQVTRKGKAREAAGDDFTARDFDQLQAIADAVNGLL